MRIITIIFLLPIISELVACTSKNLPERFNYYQPLGEGKEAIDVNYVQWAATDIPQWVKHADYVKYKDSDSLINYCFYLDAGNESVQVFSEQELENLREDKSARIYGEFYKTKQFDDAFPDKVWSSMQKDGLLNFRPRNGEFTVFVYDRNIK